MNQPLVSVIINNYNYGRFLRTAIDSVLSQTYPHIELIVVDDGSTDDSPEIIRGYGDRLRAIFQPNGGQGACFNTGFAASCGEIILFLDSDDYYHPEVVAHVVEAFRRDDVVLVQFRLNIVDSEGAHICEHPPRTQLDSGDVVPLLVSRGCFTGMVTSANAFRRDVLQQVLPLPAEVFTRSADGYLINTVPFLGKVGTIDLPLCYYRVHGGNVTELKRGSAIDPNQVRKRLDFTTRELALVLDQARKRGIRVAPRLHMRHMGHVQMRLASLKLDPEQHPFADDSGWQLGCWGALAALRNQTLSPQRRVLMAGWFTMVGMSPPSAAEVLISFLMAPATRRRWIRKLTFWKGSEGTGEWGARAADGGAGAAPSA